MMGIVYHKLLKMSKTNKIINAFLIIPMLLGLVSAYAQGPQIKGTVLDEAGSPLEGVTVVARLGQSEAGTTITGKEGTFILNGLTVSAAYNLYFSYVGFEPYIEKNVVVKNDMSALLIRLKARETNLDQVVIVGYGSMKKKDITGAISSIKGEKITEVATADVTQTLQGRVAGVMVQTQSWRPGTPAQVRVRGNRSITADNEPLYVVDGIPFVDAINQLSVNDIESIDVLKDASATAIYGNRGANGVILITTKKGRQGKSIIEYNGYYGIQRNRKLPELMDAAAFVEYSRESQRNALGGAYDSKPNREMDFKNEQLVATPYMKANMEAAWSSGEYDPSKLKATDWLSYGLRDGVMQNHQVSVRGGSEPTQFLLSADYFNNKGVVRDQDFKRYSVRINAEHRVNRIIKIGTQTVYSRSEQNAGWNDVFDGYGLKSFNPLASPYEDDGTTLALFPTNNTRTPNPITNFGSTKRVRNQDRFLGNYYVEANLLKGLNFRTNLALDYRGLQNYDFNGENTANAGGQAPASASNSFTRKFMYAVENILSYNTSIGKDHSIYATVMQSVQSERVESNSNSVKELPYDEQLYYNVGSALTINGVNSNLLDWSLASFMGRLNYGFRDKYLVTVSARYDGSSRLKEGSKWVLFPSVALAWRMKNESFLKDVAFLNDLKLRLGWGRTGNSGIAPYKTWGRLSSVRYVYGDASALGYTPIEMINPALSWETTGQFNAGLDFAIANNRVSGSIEAYLQNTHDLLLERQLPTASGFSSILSNVGKTRNKGVEVTVRTVNLRKTNWEWSTDWIFALNKQEIVELYNGKQDDIGARWFIGKPVNVYFDLGFAGIWQNTPEDLAAMKKFNDNGATFKPGDIRPIDKNNDNKIDANDRYLIGQTDPKWTASWANNIRYKNLDMAVLFVGMFGHTINHDLDMRFDGRYNQPKLNYWTPENASTQYPRPLLGTASVNYLSTLNYYSGSFVRLRNITLGYTVPQQAIKTRAISRLRVYASVQNPLLITRFPGSDPEGGTGFDEPSVITAQFGINLFF